MGLGLNMVTADPRISMDESFGAPSGSITPGDLLPHHRSTSGKAIQMDLAGFGARGDAASHASMIMQSRQAKLQRWRPNSAGKQVSLNVSVAVT